MSLYDGDWEITITKELDEASVAEQSFLFLLEYRSAASDTILNNYYGVITIPAGYSSGTIEFQDILPGVYTVTEIESNWHYELDISSPDSQPILLLDHEKLAGDA